MTVIKGDGNCFIKELPLLICERIGKTREMKQLDVSCLINRNLRTPEMVLGK